MECVKVVKRQKDEYLKRLKGCRANQILYHPNHINVYSSGSAVFIFQSQLDNLVLHFIIVELQHRC